MSEPTGPSAPNPTSLDPATGTTSMPVQLHDDTTPALGSDPFDRLADPDPFETGLCALGLPAPSQKPAPPPVLREVIRDAPAGSEVPPAADAVEISPTPLQARRWIATPSLQDIELEEPADLIDRLLDADDRRRLAALAHLVGGETPYDRFGLSSRALRQAFPLFLLLYSTWFRVKSHGHEHLPTSGPAVIASNHAGLLPFDGAMMVMDVALNTDPPRLARSVVDHWAGSLPWVNVFFARMGQIVGTRENFGDLLREGQMVLVFPEGMAGVTKRITQRYRLQKFHIGFIEQALRAEAPVVPAAVIGSDDQMPILFDLPMVAKTLGLPMAPITPTFPLLGPLGLLPYPVGYRIVYGEPLHLAEQFGPEDADDPRLVRYLARRVRREVQALIDRNR
ncbi:MAG: acyltransferase family protein [Deltaproteobacteria bacterium]|nr:acyltransferase family protein [Deltaproteobacteria bacterium]MBW2384041.1 acyltransferase family protein [Deltaproteobacteria bacterium]MBW2697473.1 acyltransferase family protein [Deltaproteobacteria bacterium]